MTYIYTTITDIYDIYWYTDLITLNTTHFWYFIIKAILLIWPIRCFACLRVIDSPAQFLWFMGLSFQKRFNDRERLFSIGHTFIAGRVVSSHTTPHYCVDLCHFMCWMHFRLFRLISIYFRRLLVPISKASTLLAPMGETNAWYLQNILYYRYHYIVTISCILPIISLAPERPASAYWDVTARALHLTADLISGRILSRFISSQHLFSASLSCLTQAPTGLIISLISFRQHFVTRRRRFEYAIVIDMRHAAIYADFARFDEMGIEYADAAKDARQRRRNYFTIY